MGILENSENPGEMPGQNRSSQKKCNIFLKIISCDPSMNTMEHPDLTVSYFMVNSIGLKNVKNMQ